MSGGVQCEAEMLLGRRLNQTAMIGLDVAWNLDLRLPAAARHATEHFV